jgi:hypothetical protein
VWITSPLAGDLLAGVSRGVLPGLLLAALVAGWWTV